MTKVDFDSWFKFVANLDRKIYSRGPDFSVGLPQNQGIELETLNILNVREFSGSLINVVFTSESLLILAAKSNINLSFIGLCPRDIFFYFCDKYPVGHFLPK